MKKALIVLLFGLVLPLASVFASETKMAAAESPIVIGMAAVTFQHPVHAAMVNEVEQAAAQLGAKVVITDARGSPSKQSADVRNLVAQGVQGILLVPMADSLVPAIETAVTAGIPVATVGDKVNTNTVLVHVGADNVQAGRAAAGFIIEKLGNKGSVIELAGPPESPAANNRKAGFDEVMGKSNVKILASQTANWSSPAAYMITEILIQKYPGFDAVFAANDEMIIGAIEAMSDAHIEPASKVTVGCDATARAFKYMKDGKLNATIDQFPRKQAGQALEYLVGYIKNKTKPPKQVIYTDSELVTKAP
jgi:ribose transport system substrate-binding protein